MNILLTNDDGIDADGLAALYAALASKHAVTVVAPHIERSAGGHAITLHDPIRVVAEEKTPEDNIRYAISGTSADCVKLGLLELVKPRPDLVVSGINAGVNDGVNLSYSGTVSAAMEASLYGIPAIAVSMPGKHPAHYADGAALACLLAGQRPDMDLPPEIVLNINVPDLPVTDIAGVAFTHQDMTTPGDWVERREDPRGSVYYWYGYETPPVEAGSGTDRETIGRNYVSITPLKADMTAHDALTRLKDHTFDLSGMG